MKLRDTIIENLRQIESDRVLILHYKSTGSTTNFDEEERENKRQRQTCLSRETGSRVRETFVFSVRETVRNLCLREDYELRGGGNLRLLSDGNLHLRGENGKGNVG
ncbi:hypothetical protein RJT34_19533 [Clitoria ternatea]|uniref:Uncharacterized protein n=1 Tax=Clitoria ternatea TaxID=43366 RepID=A0AAN9P3U9_CLITE